MIGEDLADLVEFFLGGLAPGQSMHHELGGRAGEGPLQQIADQLALGLGRRLHRFIDMRPLALVALDGAFGGHDLHRLQNAGIADRTRLAEPVEDLADGRRSLLPEDAQDVELGWGWFAGCVIHHAAEATTKWFVESTKSFVDWIPASDVASRWAARTIVGGSPGQ